MEYWDAHCHLADPRFDESRDAILERAATRGIVRFIQGGVDPADWDRQLALAEQYPGKILPCFGLHPWTVARLNALEIKNALDRLPGYLARGAVGLGELGLDHARRGGDSEAHLRQASAFIHQLGMARAAKMPLVLHIIQAHPQALNILEKNHYPGMSGIVHSFGGSHEIAARYLNLGLSISIGGTIVRKKGFETLKRAVVKLPADALVLETDSPDQPPEGWAGDLNEPSSLEQVASALGRLRGEPPEALLLRSRENLARAFRI